MGKGRLGVPLIKKHLHKVQEIKGYNARDSREPCGVGSRGPLTGSGWFQGQKVLVFFNAETVFSTQTYINKSLFSLRRLPCLVQHLTWLHVSDYRNFLITER